MKKKQQIREVEVNGVKYFAYDMDADRNGKRKRLYGRTRSEIEEKIALEMENRKVVIPKESGCVRICFEKYLDYCIGKIPVPVIKLYRTYMDCRMSDTFLQTDMDMVTTKDVNDELLRMSETVSEKLLVRVRDFIAETVCFAHTFDRMAFVRDDRISVPETYPTEYTMTDTDYRYIREGCLEKDLPPYYALLFIGELGLRVTEAVNLTWGDISADFSYVTISRKTGDMDFPLNDTLKTSLKALQKQYDTVIDSEGAEIVLAMPTDPLFLNNRKERVSTTSLQKTLTILCANCGASDLITLNSLREYRGRKLLEEGESMEYVCKALGFSSVAYTKSIFGSYVNDRMIIEAINREVADEQTRQRLIAYINALKKMNQTAFADYDGRKSDDE